ncbi:hypothetical protein OJAV_G00208930 [Oryzias javanicus]|uniref:X-linked retinitis pigmentosa GTPase regulator n=1 Tax=Oryzias javanicus TaxID=123683 RepID=A0A437C773_ORYJA|nr:hypothetical protein OJAV_G00208930 [Oryzias javanicus]
MTGQTDSDIPETGAVFTFGRSSFADNLPSKFWLKNDYPAGVCCGREHSAVITGNGKLLVFGCNSSGQLGLNLKPDVNKPVSLKAFKSEKVKFVACGTEHTIVCTSKDRVYYAGNDHKAQPGQGHSPKAGSFLRLHPFCERARIKMLSAGCSTSAALTEDGRLFMWGDNSVGQIGLGKELFAAEPREVGVGEAVKWVSCGNRHSAFVTVAGDLYTFGKNANGRLGLQAEQLENHRVPQRVPGIPGHVTQVCCGGQHTVVLTGEDVFTFGGGRYGQLGHGTFLFEAASPKPLQHFHKCSVRQIACGENHTAVITNGGLLYTFGDGRHGKLGLMEENFVNQFSPTLCTQFLKFNVQSVSCGGHHMLVLAAPRPAKAREVLEKDFKSMGNFLLSSCAELPLKEQLIDLAPVFPLSALAARARHREKKLSEEMLGETLHKLPRFDSDFLSSSWKMSRNIQTVKDIFNPPSSPMLKSGESPLLSPRSQSVYLLSPALSSKPSSSRSLSSGRSKASTCLAPKSAKLSSPLLSPKSIKCTPKKALPREKRAQTRAKKADKSLSDKLLSPKEPSSPAGPTLQAFIENISEKEDSASTQTEGDALHRPGVSQDEQERGGDFSPNTVEKKDRSHGRASTGKPVFCFDERLVPYGQTASAADPLSSSIKKDKTKTRKDRSLSNQENIPKKTIKTKKRLFSSGTAKRGELSGDAGVQKAVTEGKNDVKADKDGIKEKTHRNESNTSALTDKTSDNKVDVKVRQDTRVKLKEKKSGVKAAPPKSHSTKLEPEKSASCGTPRAKVQTKEATPAKSKGQSQEPKAKPDSKSSIKRLNKGTREIKVESANKQNGKDDEASEAKPRLSTKSGEGKSPGSKDKTQKKTKASRLLSSHHDGSSTQSPKRADVLSVSGDKSPQSPHPAGAESLPTEGDRKEARIMKEEKSGWEESLREAALLLPAVGMAGAAAGLLSEALTSVVSFHSDSDKDTPSLPRTPLRRFTNQQEVQSIPSTPTHVGEEEKEDRKPKQEEAPTPAPRTKQTAVKKKQEDPQQFWNDVLPQYLDIQ